MASKLSTSLKWQHFAEITGLGAFPIDMLRYDSCMPAKEEDARTIERVSNPMISDFNTRWTVRVRKHSDVKGHGYWNARRWESYHCTFEEVAGHEYA